MHPAAGHIADLALRYHDVPGDREHPVLGIGPVSEVAASVEEPCEEHLCDEIDDA